MNVENDTPLYSKNNLSTSCCLFVEIKYGSSYHVI
jgi:hypothetical protein